MITCDKCKQGTLFVVYNQIGIQSYQCNKCDNKKNKYELDIQEQEKQKALAQTKDLNDKITQLKANFDTLIYGYPEIKSLILDIVDTHIKDLTDKPTHLLLVGASGTSKTYFFEILQNTFNDASKICFIDCSHLSGSGLVSFLNETQSFKTLSFVILDELDKLDKNNQKKLLIALECGILSEKKYKRNISLDVSNILFFATANEKEKIYEPLLNRFTTLEIPPQT